MDSAPFIHPQPDLGKYLASFVGGTSRYREARSSDNNVVVGEFMIEHLKRKLPLEQLEAIVREYLLRRGFLDVTEGSEETTSDINSSSRKYFHPTYSQTHNWKVLVNVPGSRKDISVSWSIY